MGRRKVSAKWFRWACWLALGCVVWALAGVLISLYLDGQQEIWMAQCAASLGYVAALVFVLAIGSFARVRTLLTLQTLYGLVVLVRASIGVVTSLMFFEVEDAVWLRALDVCVQPFRGLEYISMQLTAHFVTELYWLGLGVIATILVFLSSVARMSVTNRIAREQAQRARRRQAYEGAHQSVSRR